MATTTTTINLPGVLKMLFKDYEESRTAKEARYTEGKGILESIVEMFGPGYLKGEEKKMLAEMEQGMVGRGLGGTTRPAAAGMGIKADIRDRATHARTGAMADVARYMSGFEDIYPTPGTLAHLATGGFSGMLQAEQLAMQQRAQQQQQSQQEIDKGPSPWDPDFLGGGWTLQGTGSYAPGAGSGITAGGGWQPGGLPATTGAGAATYGISGGMDGDISAPAQGFWGASEQWRSEQPEWVTGVAARDTGVSRVPTQQEVGMTGAMGSLPGQKEPTIAEYLQQHGLDPTSTDPALMGRARTLQQQWASIYR